MTTADDLMTFVVAAMNWRDDRRWTAQSVPANPEVAHYVTGWMRAGDAGVVAHASAAHLKDVPAGAAWWRTFTSEDPGYGYVADDIPELGLAVLSPYGRKGLARSLMAALLDLARAEGIAASSLSVEDGNEAARALYHGLGFTTVGRVGDSDTMVLALA